MAWILVVEDNADLREIIQRLLVSEGYSARVSENGEVALQMMREASEPPTLILLDLMMPVMDGWEFLAEIAKDSALSKIAIVVCSATPKNLPAHIPFLRKPLDLMDLLEIAEKHLVPVELS